MIIARLLFCSLTVMAAASATVEDEHGMTAELGGRKRAVSRKSEAEQFVIVEEDRRMINRKAKAAKAAKAVSQLIAHFASSDRISMPCRH
jgi:hypothetical protein